MPILAGATLIAAVAWVYLLAGHGGYWRTDQRLPGRSLGGAAGFPAPRDQADRPGGWPGPGGWPSVVAVVPARDEAAVLPLTLPSLLAVDYPGEFSVVLVDDGSTDGTAAAAAALGRNAAVGVASGSATRESPPGGSPPGAPARPGHGDRGLRVVRGSSPPEGWVGKVWAMEQGLRAAGDCEYVLFTDADIGYEPGTLTALVHAAEADRRALVSQMALLRADTGWERLIVPAFVYFFAQLYPFRRVNRPGSRIAAAAGGCMLVRREALAAAGGLERIRDARIDDIALGRLLKRPPARARCWLGFTSEVRSRRPYPRLAGLWDMVARSAYTQLRYSPALLAATVAGLLWLYLVPPAGAIAGLIALAAGGGAAAAWCAAAGLGAWALMAATYLPVLRLYRLSPLRAPGLPLIALLYAAMTVDSARRHHVGRGGEWKGRTIPARPSHG